MDGKRAQDNGAFDFPDRAGSFMPGENAGFTQEAASSRSRKCPSCGNNLFFDPATGKLKCAHCGAEQTVFVLPCEKEYLDRLSPTNGAWMRETHIYHCNNCNAENVLPRREIAHEPRARCRGNVPAVEKAVHVHFFQSLPLRQLQKGVKVGDVRMHAARGEQAVEVQFLMVFQRAVRRVVEFFVFKKFAVFDLLGDAGEFLIDDSARSHVEVPHLAVSHLPVGKAHIPPARAEQGGRIFLHQRLHVGAALHFDGVALFFLADAVAVHNDDHIRFIHLLAPLSVFLLLYPISRGNASVSLRLYTDFARRLKRKKTAKAVFSFSLFCKISSRAGIGLLLVAFRAVIVCTAFIPVLAVVPFDHVEFFLLFGKDLRTYPLSRGRFPRLFFFFHEFALLTFFII